MTGNFPNLLRMAVGGPEQTITEAAVRAFLSSDGMTDHEVLAALPRDLDRARQRAARNMQMAAVENAAIANDAPGLDEPADVDDDNAQEEPGAPDQKRYRDPRQLVRAIGLAYDVEEGETVVRVTPLGRALMRWVNDGLDGANVRVIARHAARSMSAAQLRNPTPEGRKYADEMEVFPFAFIWRALLALDGRITRDELNRGIYRTRNETELWDAIERIRIARIDGNAAAIGERAIERGDAGSLTNRRVRGWMSWASFGWTLISDVTNEDEGFRIAAAWAWETIEEAAATRRRHRYFATVEDYVEHLSRCGGLPPDLRV